MNSNGPGGAVAPTTPKTAAGHTAPPAAPSPSRPRKRGISSAARSTGEASTQNIRSRPANTGPNASSTLSSTTAASTDNHSAVHSLAPCCPVFSSPLNATPQAIAPKIAVVTSRS
ncbi:hypothetical protein SK803_07575 [Lentzea sp. BCCO 10_0856]|uniref:Uncharacterized protein n=1 Tax=Lentzea miocenica TaxID=3095431 RepID=A0ABU4SVZ6_9PSEU|nr:hypothetical protein [Lentzea sp. BCCO 10_0856]MDX8030066.1 hypothetical protein [Lentzea sp. BCCO 10_0856]